VSVNNVPGGYVVGLNFGTLPGRGKMQAGAYKPNSVSADVYDQLYAEYVVLHDYFGRGANEVMHRLRALRNRVRASLPAGPGT
jgi:hypothetical protein